MIRNHIKFYIKPGIKKLIPEQFINSGISNINYASSIKSIKANYAMKCENVVKITTVMFAGKHRVSYLHPEDIETF